MERFGRGPLLAALLATFAGTGAVAHAESNAPPARGAGLGLAIRQLDESWRESNGYRSSGVMVVGVDPRGRAARSGIVAGDVLVIVGGRKMHEPSDLGDVERSLSPDQAVPIVLARDGGRLIKIFEIAAVEAVPAVAEGPAAPAAAVGETAAESQTASPSAAVAGTAGASDSGFQSATSTTVMVDPGGTPPESVEPTQAQLGVVGKSLTPDLATALGASGVEGILVLEVAAASPADRSGLRAGDIIVRVGEQPVADMAELQRAAAASSTPVRISTLRLGKPMVELVSLDEGPPPTPSAPPSQEQLLMELRDEVRTLRREVQGLRKKLGK